MSNLFCKAAAAVSANPCLNCPSAGNACLTSATPNAPTASVKAMGLSDNSFTIGPSTVLTPSRPFCAKFSSEDFNLS